MSIYGCLFLILSIISGAISAFAGLTDAWNATAQGCSALFGTMFVISAVVGRRIKFDPVLR
jgi:uncharacterized membrane protein YtjA (UPF0391 family)